MEKPKKRYRGKPEGFASWNRFKKENGKNVCSVKVTFTVETEEVKKRKAEQRTKFEELVDKIKESPDSEGWIRLCEILEDAKEDKRINASTAANDFLELVWLIAADSVTASSLDEALEPFISDLKSSDSSAMALKRWKEEKAAKDWVIGEWEKDKSGHKSKADFSRIYARRVLNEFGIEVTERTIRERWLNGI